MAIKIKSVDKRKRGKKYKAAVKGIDLLKEHSLQDACEAVKKASFVKFDAVSTLNKLIKRSAVQRLCRMASEKKYA